LSKCIDGGDPGAGFVEHEDARAGDFVGVGDDAAAGHVGLADEEEEVEVFLGRERGNRRLGERDWGNQDD
jgi:hypothetical protein